MNINTDLAPDDEIVINSETGIVTKDGEEIYDISGEIFDLPEGSSSIQYSDNENSRDLTLEIEFQERYA